MTKRLLAFNYFFFAWILTHAQLYNPNINKELDKIDRSVSYVRSFENLGIKSVNSTESYKTVEWLKSEYASFGYDSIRIDSFVKGTRTYRNVVVTKQGSGDEYILVCGHFDTRNGPGANDNGSGIAAILETARILEPLSTNRTVLFVNFDGEEEGYTGSQYYVDNQLSFLNNKLYMVMNIDQIGGTRGVTGNDKIKCERDEYNDPISNNALSWLVTDTLTQLAEAYTSLTPVVSQAFSSDYIPFEAEGVVITGLYQNAQDKYSHRPSDTLGNMDTTSLKQAVRLTAAATIHFAQVARFVSTPEVDLASDIVVYPNPANDILNFTLENPNNNLKISVLSVTGKVVLTRELSASNTSVSIGHLETGSYVIELAVDTGQKMYKRLIINR